MRIFALAALIAAMFAALPDRQAHAFDDKAAHAVLSGAVDRFIRPAYQDLHRSAAALASRTASLCAQPSGTGLADLKIPFGDLVRAWSRAEIIRFGPVLEQNRLERFLHYPDRKSIGVKQVRALADGDDPAAADPTALAEKSVAVQGLGAFELVFFGSYPESVIGSKNSHACLYGAAIARNLETIAGELAAAWSRPDGIALEFATPGAANPLFRDNREAVTALLSLSVHGVEMWRENRIETFYRGGIGKDRPRQAIYWRSDNTILSLVANLQGLRDLWTASGMESLLDEDARSISGSILFDLDALIKATGAVAQPNEAMLAEAKYRARLDYLLLTSRDLLARLNDDYGKAIGLAAGFSFSDGD
jgi:hypothetical protein